MELIMACVPRLVIDGVRFNNALVEMGVNETIAAMSASTHQDRIYFILEVEMAEVPHPKE